MFDLFFTKTQNNQKLKPNPQQLIYRTSLFINRIANFPKNQIRP